MSSFRWQNLKNDANISCLRWVVVSPLVQLVRNLVNSAGLTLARNFILLESAQARNWRSRSRDIFSVSLCLDPEPSGRPEMFRPLRAE